jgi:hypothetical protein
MAENDTGTPPPANVPGNTSEPPDWYKNPPSWYNNNSSAPPPANPPASPPANRGDLMHAISGLPDQIVNAIREAFPPAAPQNPPAGNAATPPPAPTPPPEETPGKTTSLAEWWFRK